MLDKINNEQVNIIYSRWYKVWNNQDLELDTRLKAFSIIKVIDALIEIYENNVILDEEELDDLFIKWSKDFRPLFPEDKVKLKEKLKSRNKLSEKDMKESMEFRKKVEIKTR